MKTVTVKASKTYDIHIGAGLLEEAGSVIRNTCGGQTAAVVTDDNVSRLYEICLADSLIKNGYRVVSFVFPHGESSKNTDTFISLVSFLAREKLNRSDIVIALGGGVTGDLAGFASSCYKRGICFVQIPTTLLAAVDSSVGGKTAVNISEGKNLLGSFYQPNLVLCDVSLLSTLSDNVFREGCAEVIKYGIIADSMLFKSLSATVLSATSENNQLEDVISKCVSVKREIVTKDEFDTGERKILNFGHTVGHAIESLSNYNISHGYAVAAGIAIESRAALRMGLCKEDCLQNILNILKRYDLSLTANYKAKELAGVCLSDKKRDGESLSMIFPVEIGKCIIKEIPVKDLETVIKTGLEEF